MSTSVTSPACTQRKNKKNSKHAFNGDVFEFALVCGLRRHLGHRFEFDSTSPRAVTCSGKYNGIDPDLRVLHDSYASNFMDWLLQAEPRLLHSKSPVEVELLPSSKGVGGDRRDLKISVGCYEVGISAKVHNEYVFHPRIGPDRDVAKYGGQQFESSTKYKASLKAAFDDTLRIPCLKKLRWGDLDKKEAEDLRDTLYSEIVPLIARELNRLSTKKGFAEGLLRGTLGSDPYYLIPLTEDSLEITRIDLDARMAKPSNGIKTFLPRAGTRLSMPKSLDVKPRFAKKDGKKLQTSLLLHFETGCGDDWVFCWRFHTADGHIKREVKAECNILSAPSSVLRSVLPA